MSAKSMFLVGGLLSSLLMGSAAQAASVLSIEFLQAGYAPLVISSDSGLALYNGSYGTFGVNVTTGTGQPLLPASMGIDLNSLNISSTGGGALTLLITQTGLTSLDLNQRFVGAIGGTLAGSVTSLQYSAFADLTNTAFGTGEQIGVTKLLTDHAFSSSTAGELTGLTGSFSLTEQVVINAGSGPSLVSFDGQLSPVPLPASAPMFGAALLGLAGLGYAAKRKKAAASV